MHRTPPAGKPPHAHAMQRVVFVLTLFLASTNLCTVSQRSLEMLALLALQVAAVEAAVAAHAAADCFSFGVARRRDW
jgi:hypothetical protein